MSTYTIDLALLGKFENKLNSFKKKFSKYGDGGITYEVSAPYIRKTIDSHKQIVVDVTVEASYRISGYSFVALLEMTPNGEGNLIKKISEDVEVPTIYRSRCECDHCGASRFRKYTVLLQNDSTKEYVQVGKSCVKDYLGQDMSNYASYLNFYSMLEDEVDNIRMSLRKETRGYSFEDIVKQTLEYVKRFGYISKAQALDSVDSVATSTAVYYALNSFEDFEIYDISEESKSLCDQVVSFVKDLDTSSDYNNNLKLLLNSPYIENKNLGLVVSSVGYYLRETNNSTKKSAPPSNYIGDIGDKIEFTSTPECVYSALGEFGWTYIYRMMSNNDVIIWKTNKCLDTDTQIKIKATIKDHTEYKGVKQTFITRGKVVA
jgi:hypothetical protein